MLANHQEEKIELNLENPIFVCYLDVKNLHSQRAHEMIHQAQRVFNMYSNITVWVLGADRTEIKCVYQNSNKTSDDYVDRFISNFDNFKDLIQKSPEEFKQKVRDILISDLVDNENE